MTEPTKQLGDDWDLDKLNPTQILDDLNYALLGEWEKMGYVRGHNMKVKVTVPVRKIEELKRRVIGSAAGAITIWAWLHWNNKMRANDVPFEILPRYSFKDVKGTLDAVQFRQLEANDWNWDPKTESVASLQRRVMAETDKLTQDARDAFSPLTATGEQLDRLMDLMRSPIQRMRMEKDHPDAVPDPSLGGWMESDDSLRKRMLDYVIVAGSRGGGKTATQAEELANRFGVDPYAPPPRRPKPPGPDRYECSGSDSFMCCPDEECKDAPNGFQEWISVQDHEREIGAKENEVSGLHREIARLKRLIENMNDERELEGK